MSADGDVVRAPGDTDELRATAAVLGQTLASVLTFFVVRSTLEHIAPLALTMVRFVGSLVVLGAWWLVAGGPSRRPRGRDLLAVAGVGLLGVTINQTCYITGMAYTTPSRASLLYALTPLVVLLMAWMRGQETLDRVRLAGMVTAFVGVAAVLSERGGLEGSSRVGDAIIGVGLVAWAAYTTLGKPLLERHGTLNITTLTLLFGTLAYLPVGAPALAAAPLAEVPAGAWLGVAWLVVITSIVAFTLWMYAVQRLPASRVAVFMNLQPPLTVALSWWWLDERLSARFWLGATLAIAGVWTVQRRGRLAR